MRDAYKWRVRRIWRLLRTTECDKDGVVPLQAAYAFCALMADLGNESRMKGKGK